MRRLWHFPVIFHNSCFGNPVKNRLPATCKLAYTGQVRKNLARTGIEKSKASRYIYLQMIFNLLKRTAAAATILVALPCGTHAQEDPRHKQMQDFLHAKRSPLAEHARAFLDAADRYATTRSVSTHTLYYMIAPNEAYNKERLKSSITIEIMKV